MTKLTKAQLEMLRHAEASIDGITMLDGIMAGVASRLAAKGLVTLPAGHGYVFGSPLRVHITLAGLEALRTNGAENDKA